MTISITFILATDTIAFIFFARVVADLTWTSILTTTCVTEFHERMRRKGNGIGRAIFLFTQAVAHKCKSITERVFQKGIYVFWCIWWKFLYNICNSCSTASYTSKCFLH